MQEEAKLLFFSSVLTEPEKFLCLPWHPTALLVSSVDESLVNHRDKTNWLYLYHFRWIFFPMWIFNLITWGFGNGRSFQALWFFLIMVHFRDQRPNREQKFFFFLFPLLYDSVKATFWKMWPNESFVCWHVMKQHFAQRWLPVFLAFISVWFCRRVPVELAVCEPQAASLSVSLDSAVQRETGHFT